MAWGEAGIGLVHALVGWGLCGATMAISLAKTTVARALVIHAVAAPIIFALVSAFYFTSFAMFRSVLGTWLPFALIFASTYVVGRLMGV